MRFCGCDSALGILGNFLSEGEVLFVEAERSLERSGERFEKGTVNSLCFPALDLPQDEGQPFPLYDFPERVGVWGVSVCVQCSSKDEETWRD